MSEDMQQDAVDIASQALSKYNIEKVSALPLIVSPCDEACLCRRLLFWQGIIGLVHRRSIQEQSVLFHGHYLSILCRRCCVVHRQSNELIFLLWGATLLRWTPTWFLMLVHTIISNLNRMLLLISRKSLTRSTTQHGEKIYHINCRSWPHFYCADMKLTARFRFFVDVHPPIKIPT